MTKQESFERYQQMLIMRNDGQTYQQIADCYGITAGSVCKFLKRTHEPPSVSDEVLVDLKKQGLTNEQIGERLGIPVGTIGCKIARLGVDWRLYHGWQNGYTVENPEDRVKANLEKSSPQWEYISGYETWESHILVRCVKCGHERTVTASTARKGIRKCPNCECKTKQKSAKVKPFKPLKGVQLSLNFCVSCGCVIAGRRTRCSECQETINKRRRNVKKDRRRLAAFTNESASITVQALFKRDAGVCWLCGKPCDINADTNADEYPSIDHVIPISKGGKDRWDNIRLAHRICNARRGNKVYAPGVPL